MSAAVDRVLGSFRALVDFFTAKTNAAYLWRYSVEEVTETSFSGRRLADGCPFDDVVKIPLAPGIAGAGVKPRIGSVALVAFLDGDPSLPRVVGWDQAVPSSLTLDVSGKLHLAPTTSGTVQVGDDSAPPAQAVALAPAVSSFATSVTSVLTAQAAAATAAAAAFNGLAAFPAIVAVPALASALTTAGTAATAEATAATSAISAIGALAGTFPTGFAATKTSTK